MDGTQVDSARLDAGMRSLDHCTSNTVALGTRKHWHLVGGTNLLTLPLTTDKTRLPRWHYNIRNFLIPLIRAETPYLARLQETCRSSALDTYFSIAAVLGTHTFYMAFLPLLFWTGYTSIGRSMVHILAAGVIATGALKDMLCLPRPLSPPLLRISKSHSAALEYGFPSTHSANAVSVAVFAIYVLRTSCGQFPFYLVSLMKQLAYVYVLSIVVGRVYCGMHGFFDVIIGSAIGALIAAVQCIYGEDFDRWLNSGSIWTIVMVVVIIMFMIRMHPEPADDCPCFDDSVAFAGVVVGIEIGYWNLARTGAFGLDLSFANISYDHQLSNWIKTTFRIILGLVVIFTWRAIMKPTLLKLLPPLFRVIENAGLLLPRRYFLNASQYKSVPRLRKDENVIPQVSDIPAFFSSLRHPRKRTVSIGPQSEADAREVIATREERRRRSLSASDYTRPLFSKTEKDSGSPTSPTFSVNMIGADDLKTLDGGKFSLKRSQTEGQLPERQAIVSPEAEEVSGAATAANEEDDDIRNQEAKQDQEMFSMLLKPRVRYDVEVVTKLIVYSGIGWLACEGCPRLFESCGLEMGLYS